MSEQQEATHEFLIESHENLDQLDTDLVGLEQTAAPQEALGRIFRTLHTIKGSCAFLSFPHLESVAHAAENLLDKLRDGKVALDPSVTGALLHMVDVIRGMLAEIERSGKDGANTHQDLIAELNRLAAADQGRTLVGGGPPAQAVPLSPVSASEAVAGAPSAARERTQQGAAESELTHADTSAIADASVRLNVELLDKLMTIAGEIVLARNQILQFSQQHGDPLFQNTCRQLNLITSELQEHVMKTRLQPIGNVWNRIPRLVRDTAFACNKLVQLDTEGSDTELDKTLLEAIRDPLTHLVRNAIDHGIETPERRVAAGKTAQGVVRLRAFHEGGQVNVEISDDGAGIDPERIRHRALEQGLVTYEQAVRLSEASLLGLIFLPGFSTAATVTTLSGRGVGMDVVKTNIEKIGGAVDVQSRPGLGTTVRIRIPLTLAIVKVLVVTCAGDRYAIPQVSIVELVRVEKDKAARCIQRIHGVWVYRYRGRLLPLVHLAQVLQIECAAAPADDATNIVVLQAGERQFGLVVDGINDTQEIVVKALWKHLKCLACFAGATVMGDGRVALILDVFGLAQRTGAAAAEVHGWSVADAKPAATVAQHRAVLLVDGRERGRLAIPLDKVARLEEFPARSVEHVAGKPVVQYGGRILRLVEVSQARHESTPADDAPLPVVVCSHRDGPVGLIVERIVDIVLHDADDQAADRSTQMTSAIIQGRVTELLNVDALLAANGA